jgi:hypothetical protein
MRVSLVWTVVLSYVAAYVNSQKQESCIPVIKALCKFFEIVGGLKDGRSLRICVVSFIAVAGLTYRVE